MRTMVITANLIRKPSQYQKNLNEYRKKIKSERKKNAKPVQLLKVMYVTNKKLAKTGQNDEF